MSTRDPYLRPPGRPYRRAGSALEEEEIPPPGRGRVAATGGWGRPLERAPQRRSGAGTPRPFVEVLTEAMPRGGPVRLEARPLERVPLETVPLKTAPQEAQARDREPAPKHAENSRPSGADSDQGGSGRGTRVVEPREPREPERLEEPPPGLRENPRPAPHPAPRPGRGPVDIVDEQGWTWTYSTPPETFRRKARAKPDTPVAVPDTSTRGAEQGAVAAIGAPPVEVPGTSTSGTSTSSGRPDQPPDADPADDTAGDSDDDSDPPSPGGGSGATSASSNHHAAPMAAETSAATPTASATTVSTTPGFAPSHSREPSASLAAKSHYRGNQVRHDRKQLAFLPRIFVQATLPHRRPGSHRLVRRNGHLTLQLDAPPEVGLPYGPYARLALIHLCSQAVRSKSPRVSLGSSLGNFLRQLQLPHNAGKRGAKRRMRQQLRRLLATTFTWTEVRGGQPLTYAARLIEEEIGASADLLGKGRKPWPSELTLSPQIYDQLIRHPVPLDLAVVRQLRSSLLALDLHTWMSHRLSYAKAPCRVPWAALRDQLGAQYQRLQDFKRRVRQVLIQLCRERPFRGLRLTEQGLLLWPPERVAAPV